MSNTYRIEQIYELLLIRKRMSVNELAEVFHVTPTTIRRDLIVMEEKGLARRVRGYALAISDTKRSTGLGDLFKEEKRKIAEAAQGFLKNGMSLALDVSTTVEAIVDVMIEEKNITSLDIVTNALTIALKASKHYGVTMPGGVVLSSSACLVGMDVDNFFSNVNVDVAFLGTTGINGSAGLTVSYPLHLSVKKHMIACAKKKIAVLESSKFLGTGIFAYCDFEDIDVMITAKSDSNEHILKEIAAKGVQLVLV